MRPIFEKQTSKPKNGQESKEAKRKEEEEAAGRRNGQCPRTRRRRYHRNCESSRCTCEDGQSKKGKKGV